MRYALAVPALCFGVSAALAEPNPIEQGSYEIRYRLELPHVERWAIEKRATVCVSALIPILSANTPFGGCAATNHRRSGDRYTYEVACDGRASAKATVAYVLKDGGFDGRIAMVMGAKNMTMTEVQSGRRLGRCGYAGSGG